MDVRYYAITLNGRSLIPASTGEDAIRFMEESYYLRKTTKRIIKETRETIFEQEADGRLG